MKPLVLLRESLAAARASRIPTALVALVVAAMCFATIMTVGKQAANEAAISDRLAGPGARVLTVTDVSGAGFIRTQNLEVIQSLAFVETAIALGYPVDAVNGALGRGSLSVPVSSLEGRVEGAVALLRGRMPGPGEVMVSRELREKLGLAEPLGYLESAEGYQWAVVGEFSAKKPFEVLDQYALTVPESRTTEPLRQLRVLASSINAVQAVQEATLSVINVNDPKLATVESSLHAALTGQDIASQLAGFGRGLVLMILAVGAFFVAVVVLSDVLIRRRDLGRRRTLGITRSSLVALQALQTSVPAFLGAVAGSAVGYLVISQQGQSIPIDFTIAVTFLGCLTALLASLPPATFAAMRDPVEVMRTP